MSASLDKTSVRYPQPLGTSEELRDRTDAALKFFTSRYGKCDYPYAFDYKTLQKHEKVNGFLEGMRWADANPRIPYVNPKGLPGVNTNPERTEDYKMPQALLKACNDANPFHSSPGNGTFVFSEGFKAACAFLRSAYEDFPINEAKAFANAFCENTTGLPSRNYRHVMGGLRMMYELMSIKNSELELENKQLKEQLKCLEQSSQ